MRLQRRTARVLLTAGVLAIGVGLILAYLIGAALLVVYLVSAIRG